MTKIKVSKFIHDEFLKLDTPDILSVSSSHNSSIPNEDSEYYINLNGICEKYFCHFGNRIYNKKNQYPNLKAEKDIIEFISNLEKGFHSFVYKEHIFDIKDFGHCYQVWTDHGFENIYKEYIYNSKEYKDVFSYLNYYLGHNNN